MKDRIYKDKIHYNTRKIDSHNKPFNFITSEREGGKTTAVPVNKVYKAWRHHHRPSIILRRNSIDITTTYIDDLNDAINDFLPKRSKIKFEYKKGTIKDGIVDVTVHGKPFCRFISMSIPKGRIKSLRYEDPAYIIMDEAIIDVRHGEKYLVDEANKFKEIYNTFNRFATRHGHIIKAYWLGNPYSIVNPIYSWWKVDLSLVKPGAFLVGPNWALECYQITQELRDFILARNPLYEFDDAYTRYAFGAENVNDLNFNINTKQPDGYKLRYVFRISEKYLAFYHKATTRDKIGYDAGKFWITFLDQVGDNRRVLAVDFNNLIVNSQLITTDIRALMWRLKDAIANRDVTYANVEAGYLTEAIYQAI